jgi:integrase
LIAGGSVEESLKFPRTGHYNSVSRHSRELNMSGKIRTREKCDQCGKPFKIIEEEVIYCPNCNTRPKTFYIFLYWNGKHRIARDLDGYILDSYKRAHRLLENIRKSIDDGTFNISNYLPKEIEQFKGYKMLPKWQDLKLNKGLSQWHIRKINEYVKNYYIPYFQDKDTRRITKYHIEDFLSGLPGHLSLKTKKNIMDMLRNFCRWLYQMEILAKVPVFPVITPLEQPIKFITKEIQLKYLEFIPDKHKPIFQFLMYHPVRIGEACALKVKHFNTVNAVIEICQAVGYKNEIKSRKNRKPYYLPLSKHCNLNILNNKLPEAFVFTHNGKIYDSNYLGKIWRKALNDEKVPYINLYNATRHSIASQAVNSGIGLERISKALGHSTLEMTKKYASINVELLRDVIDGSQNDGSQVVQIAITEQRN